MPRIAVTALLALLLAAPAGADRPQGLEVKQSAHSVDVTAERLRAQLRTKGITLIADIDHAAAAARADLALRPTRLLIFGNPKLGTPLMQSAQSVGIDLPLKVLIWQDEEGAVWLGCNDPAWILARHGIDDRPAIAGKMSKALAGMTDAAAAP